MPYELSEQKKVGLGLIGFGIFFTFLAVILFFDRGLLALGNIFWLTGVAILLGWRSTLQLFTDRRNYKNNASAIKINAFEKHKKIRSLKDSSPGDAFIQQDDASTVDLDDRRAENGSLFSFYGSVSFLLGIFFIFVRWPVVGILVEIYGCIVLFSGFWPSIKAFLYQIPVIGWILQYPALLINQFTKSSR